MKKLREIQGRKADASALMDFVRRLEDARRFLTSMGCNYASRLDNEDVVIMLKRKLPGKGLKKTESIEQEISLRARVELRIQISLVSFEG